MQEKITQRTLAKIEPKGTRFFIWDTDTTGFGIEVSAKGKASYVCETRVRGTGRKVRRKIASVDVLPLGEARQEVKGLLYKASQGTDIRFDATPSDSTPLTIGQVVRDYIEAKQHKLSFNTKRDYKTTFNSCLSDWDSLPTKQLSGQMVAKKYNDLLARNLSPDYVNKVFRNLRAALNFHEVKPNPVEYLTQKDLIVPSKPRERFLNAAEIQTIYGHYTTFKSKVARVILFFILTGARKNEALKLTWGDVTSQTIEFPSDVQKNRKSHHVPIVGMLKELMGPRGKDDDLVFGFTQYSFRKPFDRFKQKEGLKHWSYWSIRDCRRTFAEHMNLIGYTESEIALASNRSSTSVTTKHYLGAQLAKENLLRKMYTDLQRQINFYWHEGDRAEAVVVPENYKPDWLNEPELTEDEWLEHQKELAEAERQWEEEQKREGQPIY